MKKIIETKMALPETLINENDKSSMDIFKHPPAIEKRLKERIIDQMISGELNVIIVRRLGPGIRKKMRQRGLDIDFVQNCWQDTTQNIIRCRLAITYPDRYKTTVDIKHIQEAYGWELMYLNGICDRLTQGKTLKQVAAWIDPDAVIS
jgi:predicted Fe-Mo cluster-binding NifX family protein